MCALQHHDMRLHSAKSDKIRFESSHIRFEIGNIRFESVKIDICKFRHASGCANQDHAAVRMGTEHRLRTAGAVS